MISKVVGFPTALVTALAGLATAIIQAVTGRRRQQPHLTGLAACYACGHRWVAVVPGPPAPILDCPVCGKKAGVIASLDNRKSRRQKWDRLDEDDGSPD